MEVEEIKNKNLSHGDIVKVVYSGWFGKKERIGRFEGFFTDFYLRKRKIVIIRIPLPLNSINSILLDSIIEIKKYEEVEEENGD